MATILSRTEPAAVGCGARLTQQVKTGGCASKLPPGTLSAVLASLPVQAHANLMVGFDTYDDTGIYRLHADEALVQTVDFFTPMVDEPRAYGHIAASNALSDIYAMGGRPITALALATCGAGCAQRNHTWRLGGDAGGGVRDSW